jgi:hypothetical protein
MTKNGAWFQRQDVRLSDVVRLIENHLRWIIEERSRRDRHALSKLLVGAEVTLHETVRQLPDYLNDRCLIPFWKAQIESINGIIRRDGITGQALVEMKNQIAFFQWRIDETMQVEGQESQSLHGDQSSRLWKMLALYDGGAAYAEPELQSSLGLQGEELSRLWKMLDAYHRGATFSQPEIPTIQVNWTLLESSGDGWRQICSYYEGLAELRHERIDLNRLKILYDQEPDVRFVGECGFEGYVALIFTRANVAILENAFIGNALYKMPSNRWEGLSQLSKTELLDSYRAEVDRIVHPETGWSQRLWGHLVEWGIIT